MSVIGVDIGDNNIYISVARLGGVDTIANEYSQRNTPSIVYFKNFLRRSLKDQIPFFQNYLETIGAEVVKL